MAASARSSGPFPELELADLDGVVHTRCAAAWRDGEALVLIGHGDCSTTRLTLPFFERIHRRRTRGSRRCWCCRTRPRRRGRCGRSWTCSVPIRLEPAPYPLAAELRLVAVPTSLLVDRTAASSARRRGSTGTPSKPWPQRLGAEGPLFAPDDRAPVFRPG